MRIFRWSWIFWTCTEDVIEANIPRSRQMRRAFHVIRIARREVASIRVFALTLYVIYSRE